MPSKNVVTISTKVDKEFADYLRDKAVQENKSLGMLVKEALHGERQAYDTEKIETKIMELCFMYGMNAEIVLANLEYLLESRRLFLEDGKIKWVNSENGSKSNS